MMCPKCKLAGEAISIGKAGGAWRDWSIREAENYHAKCEHPASCTCQHRVTLQAVAREP